MLAHHFAAARRRDRKAHNERMEQAYITAIIPLMKKAPKLQKLLVPLDDPKPRPNAMPWQQQMAAFRQIMDAKRK